MELKPVRMSVKLTQKNHDKILKLVVADIKKTNKSSSKNKIINDLIANA